MRIQGHPIDKLRGILPLQPVADPCRNRSITDPGKWPRAHRQSPLLQSIAKPALIKPNPGIPLTPLKYSSAKPMQSDAVIPLPMHAFRETSVQFCSRRPQETEPDRTPAELPRLSRHRRAIEGNRPFAQRVPFREILAQVRLNQRLPQARVQ